MTDDDVKEFPTTMWKIVRGDPPVRDWEQGVVLSIAEHLVDPRFPDDPEKEASFMWSRLKSRFSFIEDQQNKADEQDEKSNQGSSDHVSNSGGPGDDRDVGVVQDDQGVVRQKYAEAAALLRSWLNDPGDGDEKAASAIEPYLQRLDNYNRGRFIPCRGCPTVECTCFTDLEADLLDKVTKQDIAELESQVAKLTAALEFYADKFNWRTNSGKIGITALTDGTDSEIIDGHWTCGKLARAALAEIKGKE